MASVHATDASPEAPSLETLAARAEQVAPGMREVARGESPVPASIPIPELGADACIRALLGANSPVVAALVTDAGSILAITRAEALVTLDARGPVCLRKGNSARIEVQGQAPLVRYVLWMTP